MASSTYKDLTPAKKLDKGTLNRMVWRSLMLQAAFNMERMQAAGWLWSILPGLEKIHTNKEDLSASMSQNIEFVNTHPFLVNIVMGIVLTLEQQKADINTIRAVKIATAGPLGGIGDALFWFTLVPVTAGITADMAINGSLVGPILFFIIVFGVQMGLRYWLMHWSYNAGTSAVTTLTKYATEFTHAASLLGVFVVGALTCNYGGTTLGMSIPNGTTLNEAGEEVANYINVQGLLDGILPALIPLGLTLLCYFLIKKKNWTPTKTIVLLLFIGVIGCFLGIWAGDYTLPFPLPWRQ